MRAGLSLTLTDSVSKPLKAAGEVISWWWCLSKALSVRELQVGMQEMNTDEPLVEASIVGKRSQKG